MVGEIYRWRWVPFCLLLVACSSEPPRPTPLWCQAACEKDGKVQSYMPADTPKFVVRCNDDMFFNEDVPEKCTPHGGVKRRTRINNDAESRCYCTSGGLILK